LDEILFQTTSKDNDQNLNSSSTNDGGAREIGGCFQERGRRKMQ
jgi:hypothetical protein